MKRSRRLSRLADLEGEAGLQQLRSLLNTPLGKNNTVVMSRMALEKRSIPEISFPDLFHALSLTQSIPLFTPVLPPPCSKYLQTTPSMSTSSSACSSSKTINLKKRVPSFLSSPDSCDWNFNDIPSSDEPVAPTVITVPTPPTGVAPTRYVVSKRRVLVCTKFSLERKLPLDQVLLASVGVNGYKTGTEQLKVETEDNTRDVISLISNIPMDFHSGYHNVVVPVVECP